MFHLVSCSVFLQKCVPVRASWEYKGTYCPGFQLHYWCVAWFRGDYVRKEMCWDSAQAERSFRFYLCLVQALLLTLQGYKGQTEKKLLLFFFFFFLDTLVKSSIYFLELLSILLLRPGFFNWIQFQGGPGSRTDKHTSQVLLFLCSVKDSCVSGLQVQCMFTNKITDN